jgi:hypothetical protein
VGGYISYDRKFLKFHARRLQVGKMTSQAIYSSLKEASAEVKRLKIDLGSINPREVTKSEYSFGVWLNKNYREASQ